MGQKHNGMTDEEILLFVQRIVEKYGLSAEILPGAKSVGVGGDARTYTSVVNLRGHFPGHEALAEISLEICNTLPINRVTYETGCRPSS